MFNMSVSIYVLDSARATRKTYKVWLLMSVPDLGDHELNCHEIRELSVLEGRHCQC